jgi:phosphatidylserine/phosphatidylglycerophosphate/cardiolipin synthase-like enzyme
LILFLDKTSKSIDIYAPNFSDSLLLARVDEMCQSGRRVRLLIADYPGEDEQEKHGDCIQTRKMKKPLHAKVLIRDGLYTFVGSFNYTKNSLENNREMGLFLS